MVGRRLPDAILGQEGTGWEAWRQRQPGDYMRVANGEAATWWICDPFGKVGQIGGRRREISQVADMLITVEHPPVVEHWQIIEHEDGTISVRPSILDPEPDGWHGFPRTRRMEGGMTDRQPEGVETWTA